MKGDDNVNDLKKLAKKLNTPEKLFEWMQENIKYGYTDKNGEIVSERTEDFETIENPETFYNNYRLQTAESVLKTRTGVCWDQAEFIREIFKCNNIKHHVIYIEQQLKPNYPTHTFVVYWAKDKLYLIENSWQKNKGIHGPYNDVKEVIDTIAPLLKGKKGRESNVQHIWSIIDEPINITTVQEYMKFCKIERR
jgi:hypothetical protein